MNSSLQPRLINTAKPECERVVEDPDLPAAAIKLPEVRSDLVICSRTP
jgi:hypothetical protein